ncbi:cytochrome P450 [Dissophora ornata]|nr:cytochrome P450 [Dissophora ornata]
MAVASTLISLVRVDPLTALGTFIALFSSYIFYQTYLLPNFLSPLRHIPGPPNKSKYNKYRLPFIGNFLDILQEEAGVPHRVWIEEYGGLVRYLGLFNSERLLLADPKAIQHVFGTHSYNYPKSSRTVRILSQILGNGVLLAEGDAHRKQRKMLNPAFSLGHIKEMLPIMANPAARLAKIWEGRVDQSEKKAVEFDVMVDLGSATLDIIGLAGFGYDFKALTEPDNELSLAYRDIFYSSSTIIQLLRAFVPYYVYVPFKHNRDRWHSIGVIDSVSTRLIAEKRAQANAKAPLGPDEEEGKDLMSILIRGNEQVGSLEDGKLTDTELKDQILTFLAAGHETTSVTVTWMLHVFSIYPDVQKRVRDELLTEIGYPSENKAPSYDTLNALPYLNACVKELLRFIPPVPTTSRVAKEDDNILGYEIPKGTRIFLSPAALHKLKSVYGEDVEDFVPERWMDPSTLQDNQTKTKFVTPEMQWAYIPFLIGPRNCIGSKFALIETKVLIYYLLINLEYHPAPGFKFKKAARITWRPVPGMNLVVKRVGETVAISE